MQVPVKKKLTTLATVPPARTLPRNQYPDSDGRPMGETPLHRDNLAYLIEMLRIWYERESQVYIAGNMFLYYVPGNRLKHVSPDVFVVHGIPKHTDPERRRYLTWEEGKAPDVVIELTSETTREEDIDDKLTIYRDEISVREYFLFDPYEEYLDPPLQGYRLIEGQYQAIPPVDGRLPSEGLGLHLEASGGLLRLYDPATGQWLPTPPEEHQARLRAEMERQRAQEERAQEAEARHRAEEEVERLRQEIARLRAQLPPQQT
jgi:Uma2 family endonuclease